MAFGGLLKRTLEAGDFDFIGLGTGDSFSSILNNESVTMFSRLSIDAVFSSFLELLGDLVSKSGSSDSDSEVDVVNDRSIGSGSLNFTDF